MENQNLLTNLKAAGVNVSQAVERFMGNEAMFVKFVRRLPDVLKISEMEQALVERREEDFYVYLHDLKGMCGNLSIDNAFNASQAALVEYRSNGLQNYEKMRALVSDVESYCQRVLSVLEEDKAGAEK